MLTPLLVQTLGWYQVVANLVTLALVGAAAERLMGRIQWLVLFLAGTLGGQIAAYADAQPGGGDSIAICGLAGGVAMTLLVRPSPGSRWAARVAVYYVAALAGWDSGGIRMAAVACLLAALLDGALPRTGGSLSQRVLSAAAVACAAVLATSGGMHGAALMAGVMATVAVRVLLLAAASSRRPAQPA